MVAGWGAIETSCYCDVSVFDIYLCDDYLVCVD